MSDICGTSDECDCSNRRADARDRPEWAAKESTSGNQKDDSGSGEKRFSSFLVRLEWLFLNHALDLLVLILSGLDGHPRAQRKCGSNRQRNRPGPPGSRTFADCPDGNGSGDWKQKSKNDWKMNDCRVKRIGQH
jgi:hypothetical protein